MAVTPAVAGVEGILDFQRDRAGEWIRAMAFFEALEHGPQLVSLSALTDDGELVALSDSEYEHLVARFSRALSKWRFRNAHPD